MKQYLSITQRNKIDYQDMIDRNEANNEVVQQEEITQIEYEKIIQPTTKQNTDDFELFVFDGKLPSISNIMKAIDHKLPPASILERGSEAIRKYWNNKNLRKRKT